MSPLTNPASGPQRAPSIHDVAERAGVSIQTVSRVLNGSEKVAGPTRDRVRAAIDELGYRRNPAARALATGRGGVIGVIAPSSALYGPASVVASLGRAAVQAQVHLAVEHVVDFDLASVQHGLSRLVEQFVAAVVVVAPVREAFEALGAADVAVPLVSVDGADGADGAGVVDVSVDQRAGARLATEHLLGLGHETVWHVQGPAAWHDAAARAEGWREALRAAGREVPPPLEGDWSAGSGYRAGVRLAGLPGVSAVFAANDAQALGVVRALSEHGRRVPDDVSVVGFDDTPESAHYLPPLTTVRQEFAELGTTALDVVLRLVARGHGDDVGEVRPVRPAPRLVERRSTARHGRRAAEQR